MGMYIHKVSGRLSEWQAQGLHNIALQGGSYTAVGISSEAFRRQYGKDIQSARARMYRAEETHCTLDVGQSDRMQVIGAAHVTTPSVSRLRTPLSLRYLPGAYEQLFKGPAYLAAITEQSLDPEGRCLLAALVRMLGNAAITRLVDPSDPFHGESVPRLAMTIVDDQQPPRVHNFLRDGLKMKEIMTGHFAVTFADGGVDEGLLRQDATLYATTQEEGKLGLEQLRRELPPDVFDKVIS